MSNSTVPNSIANLSIAQLKALAATLDGFSTEFDKRKKTEWLAAIVRYEAAKSAVSEALEPIAIETVEPIAQSIEGGVVKVHDAIVSPRAISGYRFALRAVIWTALAVVLFIATAVHLLAVLAWDVCDGEPAIVFWVKKAASSSWGQARKAQVLASFDFVGDMAAIATVVAMEGAGLIFGE